MRAGRRERAERAPASSSSSSSSSTIAEVVLGGAGEGDRECSVHEGLRKLVQLMPQVSRGLRRRQASLGDVGDRGLGSRHSAALSLLREHGPLSVGRLAAQLGLTLPTVSGIVADMERAGFVERTTDPADRRRTIVALTAGRGDAVGAWLDGSTAPIARALGKLSPEERATFVKAMGYLEAELNGATGEPV